MSFIFFQNHVGKKDFKKTRDLYLAGAKVAFFGFIELSLPVKLKIHDV